MQSKLEAVRTATSVGESVIIANGTHARTSSTTSWPARKSGTLFLAKGKDLPAWKRWIGFTVRPKGRFVLDEGARQAIEKQGKSLLAIGITAVEGDFAKGEVVSLVDRGGERVRPRPLQLQRQRRPLDRRQTLRRNHPSPRQPALRGSHPPRQFGGHDVTLRGTFGAATVRERGIDRWPHNPLANAHGSKAAAQLLTSRGSSTSDWPYLFGGLSSTFSILTTADLSKNTAIGSPCS